MTRKMTRFLALLMAIIMCIPNSITALAAEMDATEAATVFMATINQADHGTIAFTRQTGDTREYGKGDKVDVTLRPDQGYKVSEFKVTNTDTGKVLAQKSTSDNRFTFAMPEKNVTITAVFVVTEAAIELPDNTSDNSSEEDTAGADDEESDPKAEEETQEPELEVESSLTTDVISLNLNEEIAEEVAEIAQEEIENADGYTEETMLDPLTSEYDENGLAHTLHSATLMYSVADKDLLKTPPMGTNPLSYLFSHNMEAFYTNVYADMPVYAVKDNDDYFVSFIDISKLNNFGECVYYTIGTVDTYDPQDLSDVIKYDQETGIIYIPKTFYYDEEGHEIDNPFNIQLLIAADVSYSTGKARVTINNNDSMLDIVAEEQTINTDMFDVTVTVPVTTKATADNFDLNRVEIYINDGDMPTIFPDEDITFDYSTGELTFAQSGLTLYSIRIVIKDGTLADKARAYFTDTAYAEAEHPSAAEVKALPATLTTFSQMKVGDDLLIDKIANGDLFYYKGIVVYSPTDKSLQTQSSLKGDANKTKRANVLAVLRGGIGSSAPYQYWNYSNNTTYNKQFNKDLRGENGKSIKWADVKDNIIRTAQYDTGANKGNFKSQYIDFVVQPPGTKDITVKSAKNITQNKVKFGSIGGEWLRSPKSDGKNAYMTSYNIQMHANAPNFDVRVQKTSSVKSKVEWKNNDGSTWNSSQTGYGSKSVGDVTYANKSINARSLLSLRCTQEDSAGYENFETDETIYFRVLNINKENRWMIFGLTTGLDSVQNGHAIYKIKWSEPKDCSLLIQKKIQDAEYFVNNPSYTVAGATYRMYKDEACTDPLKVDGDIVDIQIEATTNNTVGEGRADGIPEGTYYVKELPPPVGNGVEQDPTTYMVTLSASTHTYDKPLVLDLATVPAEPTTNEMPGFLIHKRANTTALDLESAVFGLYYLNPVTNTYTKIATANVSGAGNANQWTFGAWPSGQPVTENMYVPYQFPNLLLGDYQLIEEGRASDITDRGVMYINGVTYPIPTAANPLNISLGERKDPNDANNKIGVFYIGGTQIIGNIEIDVRNEHKYYGFSVNKKDLYYGSNPQGNATNLKATFQLIAGTGENNSKVSVNPTPTTKNNAVGTSYNAGQVIMEFTTDNQGNYKSAPYLLSPGTYQIKEKGAPTGYRLDVAEVGFTITSNKEEGSITQAEKLNEPQYGSFAMQKYDNELDEALAQGAGELNATFQLVNKSTNKVRYKDKDYEPNAVMDTFTLNKDNKYTWYAGTPSDTKEQSQKNGALPYGSYQIVETKPGTGYLNQNTKDAYGIDTQNTFSFTISKDKQIVWAGNDAFEADVKAHFGNTFTYDRLTGQKPLDTMENTVTRTGFEIHKVDAETGTANDKDMTAEFKLVYYNTKNSQPVLIDKNQDGKLDKKTELFYSGDTVFEFTTDKDGNYKSPADLLPYTGDASSGVYYELFETKAPKRYWGIHEYDPDFRMFIHATDNHKTGYTQSGGDTEIEHEFATKQKVENLKMRYDINFTKKKEGEIDSKLLANVPFRITLLDDDGNEVETHIVWTDESGYYDSSSDYTSHKNNTNYGDNYTTYEKNGETYYALDKSGLAENRNGAKLIGTWFYGTSGDHSKNKIWDYVGKNKEFKIGAFIDGNYKIEELRCEANEGLRLFEDTFNIQAFEGYYNKDLGTYDNADYGLSTIALTKGADSHYAAANDELVIVDDIMYSGLAKGSTFTLVTSIHDAETGALLLNSDGTEAKKTTEFVSKATNGTVKVELDFDATGYEGRSIVIYEEVYDEDGKLLVFETDQHNEEQQIHFPAITTELTDTKSEMHMAKAAKGAKLVDVVTFKNLEAERTYKVKGYLVDLETLDYAKDDKGRNITAEASFKPTKSSGSVEVVYEFDAETLAGKTFVAFEYLTQAGNDIALHEDIEDELQTIYFPEVGTTAYDEENGTQMSYADDVVTVVDTVAYSNVLAGFTYTVTGKLIDKETGEPIRDAEGNDVTGSAQFIAEETSGTIDVVFTFDGTGMAGHTLVAFENLYITKAVAEGEFEDVDIAEHSDLEDASQTIYIPRVLTTATDTENESHMVCADGSVSINDTVAYENLVPGLTYEVQGYLMDKATGDKAVDADGNEITGMTQFVPEEANGTVDVLYEFNGSNLEGHTVVVFEYAYVMVEGSDDIGEPEDTEQDAEDNAEESTEEDSSTEDATEEATTEETDLGETENEDSSEETGLVRRIIASHEDIEDEGQTIYFPHMGTLAYDDQNHLNITKSGEKEIIRDTVAYSNVIPGEEYTITGRLYDKETGETLKDEDGNEITAEVKFIAQNEIGVAEIVFEVDTSKLAGHSLVAFEKLLYKDYVIGEHEDEDDEDETVYVPKIGTQLVDRNGMHISLADDTAIITDTIKFEKLVPGYTYIMAGQLMDKATGQPITLLNADNADDIAAQADEIIRNNMPTGTEIILDDSDEGDSNSGLPDWLQSIFDALTGGDKNNTGDDTKETSEENTEDTEGMVEESADETTEDEATEDKSAEEGTGAADGMTEESTGMSSIVLANVRAIVDQKYDWTALSEGTITLLGNEFAEFMTTNEGTVACAIFTPAEADGEVTVTFEVDTSALKGITTVAFEELFVNGWSIAEHKDIEDEGQSIHYPDVHTTATDAGKGTHYSEAGAETTIRDVVEYTNLIVGETYTVSGTLIDKATNTAVVDANGTPVTAQAEFVAEAADGTISLDFVFDSTAYAGHSLVAFEDLYTNGILVGKHEDFNDEDQTVNIVKVGTKAVDKKTTINVATEGSTTIIDTVEYEGLIPGQTYVMSGVLMDKETGESLKSSKKGNPVATLIADVMGESNEYISETSFVPEASSGSVQIKFAIDTTDLDGKTIVVFEKLYYGVTVIASHEDIEDEDQSVHVPKIGTTATVGGKHEAAAAKDTTLVDKVKYTNLVPGKKYTIKGTLMDKKTGKAFTVDGKKVTASKTFTPKKANGTVNLTFKFDATSAGTLVAYEKLYYKKVKIAEHTDIKDADQTVTFTPGGGTPGGPGTPTEKVKTGDSWMLILLLLAIAGLSFGVYYARKKKTEAPAE